MSTDTMTIYFSSVCLLWPLRSGDSAHKSDYMLYGYFNWLPLWTMVESILVNQHSRTIYYCDHELNCCRKILIRQRKIEILFLKVHRAVVIEGDMLLAEHWNSPSIRHDHFHDALDESTRRLLYFIWFQPLPIKVIIKLYFYQINITDGLRTIRN